MSLPLKWEFPGGKINDGESPEECLKRELVEELGIEISVGQPLPATTHTYPTFTVTLYPFSCTIISGEITLHEHSAMVWLPIEKLHTLDWAEADWPVIEECREQFDRDRG
jgi:8-oxo-dGTP diphosphatase